MEARLHLPRTTWLRTVLVLLGATVLAIGAIVFFVSHVRSGGESAGPLPALPNPPVVPKVDQTIEPEARRVAGQFILTAVARKNTGASWDLLPTYMGKDEFTRKTWARGDIPVIPYQVGSLEEARFNVSSRIGNELVLEVALIPKKNANVRPEVFEIGLLRHRSGAGEQWLVEFWQSRYRAGRRPPAQ